jgi:hypothetical protein
VTAPGHRRISGGAALGHLVEGGGGRFHRPSEAARAVRNQPAITERRATRAQLQAVNRLGFAEQGGKSASQFLNKTNDPRLSMIQQFADALSISPKDIFK